MLATEPSTGDSGTREVTLVQAGQQVNGVDIVVEPLGVITGRVLDPDGQPIGGQTVTLILGGGAFLEGKLYTVRKARTADDGSYVFARVGFGEYPVTAVRGKEAANGRAFLSRLATHAVVDLRLVRPTGRTSGRVLDESGLPVAAEVTLTARAPDVGGILGFNEVGTIISDPDRGFTFTGVFAGAYTVTASSFFSSGGSSATASGVLSDASPVAENITLVLASNRARLHGCVMAPDGTRIAPILDQQGVPLQLSVFITSPRLRDELKRDPLNTEPDGIRADASEGCYRSPIHLPPDIFTVDVYDTRPGSPTYGLVGRSTRDLRKSVDDEVDVRLLGLGAASVEVVDSTGRPLPGVTVEVQRTTYPNDSSQRFLEQSTNETPAVFDGLTEGPIAVSAVVSADPAVDVGGRDDLRGFGGRTVGEVIRGERRTLRIVIDAAGIVTGRLLRTDRVTPVANAQVELRAPGRPVGYDVTNANGEFRFDGVPVSTFTLDGFEPSTGRRGHAKGQLTADGQHVFHDMTLGPLGTVRGIVLDANGAQPITGAEVSLVVNGDSARTRRSTTGADGLFEFTSVTDGVVAVTAVSLDNLIARDDTTLDTEGQQINLQLLLEGSGRVEGTVLGADGAPVPSARITIVDASGRVRSGQAGPTGPQAGTFHLGPVPIGPFTIRAQPLDGLTPGDGGEARGDVVSSGETVRADVQLQGTITVGVAVSGTVGGSAVNVSLTSNGAFGGKAVPSGIENGVTIFREVPRAPFTVAATQVTPAGAKISAAASVSVDALPPAGARLVPDLELALTPVATVRGVVRTTGGAGVPGTRVTLSAGVSIFAFSDNEGAFEFVGVPLNRTLRLDAVSPDADLAVFFGSIDSTGAVFDRSGAALEWVTMMLDIEPPTVTSMTPGPGAVGVVTDGVVTIRFSEAVDPASVQVCTGVPTTRRPSLLLVESTGTMPALNDPNDPCDDSNIVAVTATVSSDGLTVTLTPKNGLTGATQHALSVTGGQFNEDGVRTGGIQDLIGRPLGAEFLSTFVTRDNVAPRVLFVSPANGDASIAADSVVRITFSEPVAPASVGAGSISITGPTGVVGGRRDLILGNTVVVFTPTDTAGNRAYLATNTSYTVRVAGVIDMAGNALRVEDVVQAAFRTLDTVAPLVSSVLAPSEAREGERIQVTARSSDGDIRSVEFFVDGVSAAIAQTPVGPGEYRAELTMPGRTISVTARAIDTSGNVGVFAAARTVALLDRQPSLSSVLPASARQGETVTISVTGADTHFVHGTTTVGLGAGVTVSDIYVSTGTSLTARVTIPDAAEPGARTVTVTTGTETASAAAFTVNAGIPVLTASSPASAAQGQSVVLTIGGRFTNFTAALPSVNIGSGITVRSVSAITATSLAVGIDIGIAAVVGGRDVSVTLPGGPTLEIPGGFAVTPARATLQGRVLRAGSGASFGGVALSLTANGTSAGNAISAADGSFAFADVAPGSFRVDAVFGATGDRGTLTGTLQPNTTQTSDLTMNGTGSVTVTVRRGTTPVAGAAVRLTSLTTYGGVQNGSTTPDGSVTFPNVLAGGFEVLGTDPQNTALQATSNGTVAPDGTQAVTIQLPSSGTVTGVVSRLVNTTPTPAGYALLAIYTDTNAAPFKTVTADVNGSFTFTNVPAGRFYLYAADGHWPALAEIAYATDQITASGQTIVKNLTVRAGGRLVVRLRTAADEPIDGGTVVAVPTSYPAPPIGFAPAAPRNGVTDATGTLTIDPFPSGSVDVTGRLGSVEKTAIGTVPEGGTLEVTLLVGATEAAFGRVFTVQNGPTAFGGELAVGARTAFGTPFTVLNGSTAFGGELPIGARHVFSPAFTVGNIATELPAGQRQAFGPAFTVRNRDLVSQMGSFVSSPVFSVLNGPPAFGGELPAGTRQVTGPTFTVLNGLTAFGGTLPAGRNEAFGPVFLVKNEAAPAIAFGAQSTVTAGYGPASLVLVPFVAVPGERVTASVVMDGGARAAYVALQVDGVTLEDIVEPFDFEFTVPDKTEFTISLTVADSDGNLIAERSLTVRTTKQALAGVQLDRLLAGIFTGTSSGRQATNARAGIRALIDRRSSLPGYSPLVPAAR